MSDGPTEHLRAAAERVLHRCDLLARCTEDPGRITRRFLTRPMKAVHEAVTGWMEDAGLAVRVDPAGNIVGRTAWAAADAPALVIGSHLDTVPDAGRYDGILGVVLGIEVADLLHRNSRPRRAPAPKTRNPVARAGALEVVGFSEEEGVRFRTPYLGSLAFAGAFEESLLELRDGQGIPLRQAVSDYGLDPAAIPSAARSAGAVFAYVEAHIEQGPVLESRNAGLGVVEAIAGQTKGEVVFTGMAGHAGTSPMPLRKDALAGASEWVLAVEALARASAGLVATVGRAAVEPGATNVIPGTVRLSLDVRHAEDRVRTASVESLLAKGRDIAARRGLQFADGPWAVQPAVPMEPFLTQALSDAVSRSGRTVHRMVSGAGHDAAIMARIAPATMLFLRSPGGVSHHPSESVLREDVEAACEVLAAFVDAKFNPPPGRIAHVGRRRS